MFSLGKGLDFSVGLQDENVGIGKIPIMVPVSEKKGIGKMGLDRSFLQPLFHFRIAFCIGHAFRINLGGKKEPIPEG